MKHLLLVFSAILSAQAFGAGNTITRAQFIEGMRSALPNAFCSSTQYFRKCFKVTENQCIDEATRATKVCIKTIETEIPAVLRQPDDGRKWGTKLGECTGKGYEMTLSKSKIDMKDCKDPSKWK